MRTWIAALLPPLITFAIYYAFLGYVGPYGWFLFYPALFAASWLGGVRAGLIATLLSTVLVWWFFIPPEHAMVKDHVIRKIAHASTFAALGVAFTVFHARMSQSRERVARALQARRLFAALVENSSDFIGIADAEGKVQYINPAGRKLVGLAPDYPIETTRIPEYYPPEEREFALDVILKAMLEHGHWQGETGFRHWGTGGTIPVDEANFLIRDVDTGQVLGMSTVTRDISERKRLERLLAETSADLNSAQAVAKVGSWRRDEHGGVLSDELYRIFGFPPGSPITYADLLGRVHEDDRARADRCWKAVIAGEALELEYRIVVGGETRWVWAKANHGIGVAQDVTAQRRLEDDLRLSHARSSGILAISADAIISIDEQQRITMFNEGAERTFGYTRAEAIGASLDLLIPERLREVHRKHVDGFAASPEVARRMGERTSTLFGRRKNGEEFPADASISRLEVGGRRVLTVSVRDATADKRAAAEQTFLADLGSVLGSSLGYDETLANVADIVVRHLADFCIVDLLEADGEPRRVKVASRDPYQAWVCDLLARADRPSLVARALAAKESVLLGDCTPDAIAQLADTEEHAAALRAVEPRSIIAAPLIARGTVAGAIVLVSSNDSRLLGCRDVSLVEEVARRAALSIDNARLYRAAQRAIQSRDDVLGVVAHDLRNPLNAIGLNAALLRDDGDAPIRARADAIDRAASRMSRLIQDLLDVTRMEAGKLALERAPVAVLPVLADCVDAHRPSAAAASIELVLEATDDAGEVWADRDRLLQILENLIGNAIKFTDRGRIALGAAARDGDVLFWVKDTGTGIAPADQSRVFERFWQAGDAKKRGAGLGLPIVKGLVEAHGGSIWLDSAPGRGTAMLFTIPKRALHAG